MSFPASKTKQKKLTKGRGANLKPVRMQITSLVDMMTVLVVFLLKSFSAEGDIITPSEGLTLPTSTAVKKPEQAFKISVTQENILVEGKPIVSVSDMMQGDDIVIPELAQILEERRTGTEEIAKYSTTVKFKGDIIIESDKRIQFKVLQRVMYTCGQTGFSNFSLLVLSKEAG